MKKEIVINCYPQPIRPNQILERILYGTGIKPTFMNVVSRNRGRWEWDYSHISNELWENAIPRIRSRFMKIAATGILREGYIR